MRAQPMFMNAGFRKAEEAGGDATRGLGFGYRRIASIRRKGPEALEALLSRGPVEVRCALADIGGEAPEKLITNLPPGRFSPGDPKEPCHLRWGVETCFQTLKDRPQVENMTGTRPILIEQDIYASARLLNVAFDIANEADAEAQTAGAAERRKHETTASRGFALTWRKASFWGMIMADDAERESIMARIVRELSACLAPARGKRSYPRDGVGRNYANRYGNARKRVF